MKQILLIIISLLLFTSCEYYKRKSNIENTIEKLYGKEVIVPDSLKLFYSDNYIKKSRDFNIQIISCIDGNCSECARDLNLWKDFISQHEMSNEVNFNFYIYSNSYFDLEQYFNKKKFTFPFIKDSKSKFIKQNCLPADKAYHTFLTVNNKIVLLGNPMRNERLKEIYLKTINKELFGNEIVCSQ